VIVTVLNGRGDPQFNMASVLLWGLMFLTSHPSHRGEGRGWHEEKFWLDPAGIELMTFSTGSQCITPRPLGPSRHIQINCKMLNEDKIWFAQETMQVFTFYVVLDCVTTQCPNNAVSVHRSLLKFSRVMMFLFCYN
jgi:hypothetical protein